jgi:hypothetical protein
MQKNNSYSNSRIYTEMPGDLFASKYVVHADCSSFVENMFYRSKSGVLEQIRTKKYSHYSLRDFYSSIATSEAFIQLNKVVDLQPGDVVMWLYVEHHQLPGHILFVDSNPVKIEPYAPMVDGLDQYEVWVIDTSQEAKSLDDTRYVADEKTRQENRARGAEFGTIASPNYKGVGRGHIRLYADTAGEIKGVAFGFPNSRFHPQETDWRIAMGRPRVKGN